jgi:hypothetical protein
VRLRLTRKVSVVNPEPITKSQASNRGAGEAVKTEQQQHRKWRDNHCPPRRKLYRKLNRIGALKNTVGGSFVVEWSSRLGII